MIDACSNCSQASPCGNVTPLCCARCCSRYSTLAATQVCRIELQPVDVSRIWCSNPMLHMHRASDPCMGASRVVVAHACMTIVSHAYAVTRHQAPACMHHAAAAGTAAGCCSCCCPAASLPPVPAASAPAGGQGRCSCCARSRLMAAGMPWVFITPAVPATAAALSTMMVSPYSQSNLRKGVVSSITSCAKCARLTTGVPLTALT